MSQHDCWETPQDFFDKLNEEFNFTLDPCCVPATAKCDRYFTPVEDGLKQDWSNETVYMNPPYGREIGKWMQKAYESCVMGGGNSGLLSAFKD
jgi:phage N-6-adenine-methyltransferase